MAVIYRYYAVLGLAPTASAREIKQAHRDLVRLWHPDRFASGSRLQAEAIERLKEINVAYQQLAQFRQAEILSTPQPSNWNSRPSRRGPVVIRPPGPLSKGAKISLAVPIGVICCVSLILIGILSVKPPIARSELSDSVFANPAQFTAERLMWDSLWVTGDSAHVATRYGVSQASVLALKVRGEREGWPKPTGAVTQDAVR